MNIIIALLFIVFGVCLAIVFSFVGGNATHMYDSKEEVV